MNNNNYTPPTITDLPHTLTIHPTPNRYPATWPAIAQTLKDLAGWRCEHCDHPHDVPSGHVLTVHHLDMVKHNCRYNNLVALCQKCHLRWQATYHPAQAALFPADRPAWMVRRGLG